MSYMPTEYDETVEGDKCIRVEEGTPLESRSVVSEFEGVRESRNRIWNLEESRHE